MKKFILYLSMVLLVLAVSNSIIYSNYSWSNEQLQYQLRQRAALEAENDQLIKSIDTYRNHLPIAEDKVYPAKVPVKKVEQKPIVKEVINQDEIIALINAEREKIKIAPLKVNKNLNAAAKKKAEDEIKNNYFAHTSPVDGKDAGYFATSSGYKFAIIGENLSMGYSETKEIHAAFMDSPTHRANILDPDYKDVGIGRAYGKIDGVETVLLVEIFGRK